MKTHMKRLMVALACCAAAIPAARAHAFLDHAEPKVGSTLKVSPAEVKIWFTENLILPFSDVRVMDAAGHALQKADKHLDPAHGDILIVSLPPLNPGKYTVDWKATSVDTHVTTGSFTFVVGK